MNDHHEDTNFSRQTLNYIHPEDETGFCPTKVDLNSNLYRHSSELVETDIGKIKNENEKPGVDKDDILLQTPKQDKLKNVLKLAHSGSVFKDALNLLNQDTPEQDRQSYIKQTMDRKSRRALVDNLVNLQMTTNLDLPSIDTQPDQIQLNDDDGFGGFEVRDTPLKNKISVQTLRNERIRKGTTSSRMEEHYGTTNKIDVMGFDPSIIEQHEIITIDEDHHRDNDYCKDTTTDNLNNNETIISNIIKSNSVEPQGLQRSQPVNTQLIQSFSNDLDNTDSISKHDKNSALLGESSNLHTSPISFTSYHHSLHPSTQILISGIETQKSSHENDVLVQSSNEAASGNTQVLMNLSSAGTDEDGGHIDLNSQGSDMIFHKTPQTNEMRFKLAYSINPSQNMSSNQCELLQNDTQLHCSIDALDDGARKIGNDTNLEFDQTQELPEIFETSEKEKTSILDSQKLFSSSKNRQKNLLIEDDADFEDSSTPNKKLQKTHVGSTRFPVDIRRHDPYQLTNSDIVFEDAVWYYYSDCNYYPGRLVRSATARENYCIILFEKQRDEVRIDDIYYLDLRCGDRVQWDRKEYEVFALERKKTLDDQNVIRCVRGYDTVHLRKVLKNGKLGKKSILKDIASIHITTKEWVKRLKINLNLENGNPFQSLDRLRSRCVGTSLSPGKRYHHSQSTHDPDYYNDTFHDTTIMSELTMNKGNIFHRCLFMISGLCDVDRKKIMNIIELQAGHVINSGLHESLVYDSKKGIFQWANKQYEQFKFVCLISSNFSRSPKYLETLALGWPVIHWKFIEHCVSIGSFEKSSIFQFLLPSGESVRLSNGSSPKQRIIKSSNIFRFYTNLMNSVPLSGQFDTSSVKLTNFAIFVFGHSEMDSFLNFTFQCFSVKTWEFSTFKKIKQSTLNQETLDQLLSFINTNNGSRIIIFINDTNLSNISDWEKLIVETLSSKGIEESLVIENKEWLIQTIINESV